MHSTRGNATIGCGRGAALKRGHLNLRGSGRGVWYEAK